MGTIALNLEDICSLPGDTFFLLYVALTRVKRLDDIFVTSQVPKKVATTVPPPDLLKMWNGLLEDSDSTRKAVAPVVKALVG